MRLVSHIRTAIVVVLVAVGIAACGGGTTRAAVAPQHRAAPRPTTTSEPAVERPTDATDRLVRVGRSDARMHIACSGAGDATVLFISGFGDGGDSWGAVTPALTGGARICTYARFGTGTSDAPPTVQTFASQAGDLGELLRAAGEPGPYVLVGHSFGGDVAVTFAARHRDDVRGLVLVDASVIGWPAAACAVRDNGSPLALGFVDTCRSLTDPGGNPERLDGVRAFEEVAAVRSLGDVPMAVLTRADVSYPGLDPADEQALVTTWNDGLAHWASLSSSSAVVPVPQTGHYIQTDQPAVVIDHILDVLRRGA